MDQAVRARPSGPRAPSSAGTGTACSRSSRSCAASPPSSWTARRTSRRGRRWRRTSPPSRERAGVRRPLRLPLGVDAARGDAPTATGSCSTTTDGEYRCRYAIFAVGVAEPYSPATPGIELAVHYADTRDAESYAGKRLFIIGKQNSGFELASGLLQWASRIALSSPSPAKTSIETHSLVGVRARYVQPFEDSILGGGVDILAASIKGISRGSSGALVVSLERSDNALPMSVEADEVIAATGFTCPLRDLPELGVATFGQSKLPAQTEFWESATVPGIFFAGTITQGSAGLKKHGIPPNSGALHGYRYNARVLVREIAQRHFGIAPERPPIAVGDVRDHLLAEATLAPELWHQKAYLASVVSLDPDDGVRDEGILPLTNFLDAGGPGRRRDDDRGGRHLDLPGRVRPPGRHGRRSTRSSPTRCTTSRASPIGGPSARSSTGSRRARPPPERPRHRRVLAVVVLVVGVEIVEVVVSSSDSSSSSSAGGVRKR